MSEPRRLIVRLEQFTPASLPWIDSASANVIETDDDTGVQLNGWRYGGVAILRPRTGAGIFVVVRDWPGPPPRLIWALAHPRRWLSAAWRSRRGGPRTLIVDTRHHDGDGSRS